MRLIDADKIRNEWLYNGSSERVYNTNDFLDSIDEQPTIDAIPVPCNVNRYNPVCPIGKTDCVNDPAYAHFYHPEWYKEAYGDMTPDKVADKYCSPCVTDRCYCNDYDIEDK